MPPEPIVPRLNSPHTEKLFIGMIVGLIVGGGVGYFIGNILGEARGEAVGAAYAPALAEPTVDAKTNPLGDIKVNPFD